jgi:hypothetical protein
MYNNDREYRRPRWVDDPRETDFGFDPGSYDRGYSPSGDYDRGFRGGYSYREPFHPSLRESYDRGYDAGFRARDRNSKSRYETDYGDPFGDRARRTPFRAVRGEYDDRDRGFEPPMRYYPRAPRPFYNFGAYGGGW